LTENIPGINGSLAATQSNTEAPVLQLTNLHGDIIATAYLSETATALASKADTSEFGVPTTSLPPKYSWLGSLELPTELPSGVVAMGARSYVPTLGRFLQPDPRPGGSANAYTYTFGDPVNTSDPSGEYTIGEHEEAWTSQYAAQNAANAAAEARHAAEEAAARAEAQRLAEQAAWAAEYAGPQFSGGEEEYWEEYEEEGESGYEYISSHGSKAGSEEHHVEPAILVQPIGNEAGESEAGNTPGSVVPLCVVGSEGPCSLDAKGKQGEGCGSMYGKPCHHSGGGGGGVHIQTACEYVGGAIGGVAGGLLGSLIGGPEAGGVAGGVAGGAFGTYAGHEYCK
jgi:RHS repeat-associated protein